MSRGMSNALDMMMLDITKVMTSPPTTLQTGGFKNALVDVNDDKNLTERSSPPYVPIFIPCDNPHNALSPFTAHMVDSVVYAGIFPVLVTCGVITNVINMVVFSRQGLSDRIHLCLFSLALSDTGFLLFLMAGKSYALLALLDPEAGNYWLQQHNGPVLATYLAFLAISNVVTAIVALERCRCVLTPLKAAHFFKTKSLGWVLLTSAVTLLVLENVTLGLKYQTLHLPHPLSNTSTYISRLTPLYLRHRTLMDVLDIYLASVTLPLLSLLVVVVSTALILLRLKVVTSWRRQAVANMTSLQKKDMVMTRMLVTVCCVYVVTMTPSVTRALVLFSRLPGFLITGHLCNVFKVSTAFTLLLEAVNASVNFLIYVRQSSHYRATLRVLLHCGLRHKQQQQQRKKKMKTTDLCSA